MCSGHGVCNTSGTVAACQCDAGFTGADCAARAPEPELQPAPAPAPAPTPAPKPAPKPKPEPKLSPSPNPNQVTARREALASEAAAGACRALPAQTASEGSNCPD
eukprot:scaffold39394_cov30-Phaeocystis_antarctica.AAC.1